MPNNLILAVDFDGTIVTHEYPAIGRPVPRALECLRKWQQQGVRIVLWTMRSGESLAQAVAYLERNGIELFGVNENREQTTWSQSPKAYAHAYIDDAAVGCPLRQMIGVARPIVDWVVVEPFVEVLLRQYQ